MRLRAVAAALLLCSFCIPAAGDQQLSSQHLDDLRNGYRALSTTFYRGLAPDALVAGARAGIAAAIQASGHPAPPLPALRPGLDPVAQIAAAVAAGRRAKGLSETALTFAALDGMARAAGDRYTVFLTPKELRGFE